MANPEDPVIGNCEEERPEKPVGRLSVNCRPTDRLPTANQQVTDRLRKKKNSKKLVIFYMFSN